jgi:hypothetical protein
MDSMRRAGKSADIDAGDFQLAQNAKSPFLAVTGVQIPLGTPINLSLA